MIYYNLESEYPGDFTKHCGLTIAEADGNFYELESMIMDMKKNKIGPTLCFAYTGDENSGNEIFGIPLQVETVDSSTFVINGEVPYFSLGTPYHICAFIFENPFFSGLVKNFGGLSVFINNTPLYDFTKNMWDDDYYALIPDIFLEFFMEFDGDEYIMNFPAYNEDDYSVENNSNDSNENSYPLPVTPIPTVNKSFNIRVEKMGVVVCDCKVIFGEDFHLLPVPIENDYTEIVPDTEICTPGTVIDVEHQQYEIENHDIRVTTVVDVSECVGSEKTYFDFPQNFHFGFSIVGSKTPGTEEVPKDEWINIMEQLYPDAEYSAYLVGSGSASIPIIDIVNGMFWEDLSDCNGTRNFMAPFTLTVNALHEDRSAKYSQMNAKTGKTDIYHTVTLAAFDSKTAYNIGKFYETGFNGINYSMVFQIKWNNEVIEKYTFVFDCTLGKYCRDLE